jgi:hypothetical protein
LSVRIDPPIAQKLFEGLSTCLRESDFIGWYRGERAAGAVLTQRVETAGVAAGIPRQMSDRISAALREGLPLEAAERLRVRVYQLSPGSRR